MPVVEAPVNTTMETPVVAEHFYVAVRAATETDEARIANEGLPPLEPIQERLLSAGARPSLKPLSGFSNEDYRVHSLTLRPGTLPDGSEATFVHFTLGDDVLKKTLEPYVLKEWTSGEPRATLCEDAGGAYSFDSAGATLLGHYWARADREEWRTTLLERARAAVARGEQPEVALECTFDEEEFEGMHSHEDEMAARRACNCLTCVSRPLDYGALANGREPMRAHRAAPSPAVPHYVHYQVVPRVKDSHLSGTEWRTSASVRYSPLERAALKSEIAATLNEWALVEWHCAKNRGSLAAEPVPLSADEACANAFPIVERRCLVYRSAEEAHACMWNDVSRIYDAEYGLWASREAEARRSEFDPARPETFEWRSCMQPGCNRPCDHLYALRKQFRVNGDTISPDNRRGAHRLFCGRHCKRGDQDYEDCDANYERVWQSERHAQKTARLEAECAAMSAEQQRLDAAFALAHPEVPPERVSHERLTAEFEERRASWNTTAAPQPVA